MRTKLGNYLRRIRLDNHLILKDMANDLNVSSAFLSAVENGKKKMPAEWTEKITNLYHLDANQKDQLSECALESQKDLTLNLQNASDSNKKLAVLFARSFEDIDDDTNQKITALLTKNQRKREADE